MSGPSVGALFAGFCGVELGLSRVWPGSHPVWVSEIDPGACAILAHHWPDVPNLGDVTAVDWSQVEPVEVLTGGFPCQDVSHAGKRAGLKAGTRSGLWAVMCDAVAALRPRLVVAENVRGLLSAEGEEPTDEVLRLEAARDRTARTHLLVQRKLARARREGKSFHARQHQADAVRLARRLKRDVGAVRRARAGLVRAIGTVLRDLADIGYDAAWVGLRAAEVGAPHGRFRVFVLAWPQGDAAELTWPQGDAAELTWPQGDAAELLPTPAVNDMGRAYTPGEWDQWTDRMRTEHGNGNGHGKSLHIEALRLLPTPTVSDTNGPGEHGAGGADLRTAVSLLPTPTTEPTTGNGHARNLGAEVQLVPTPRATRGDSGTETMYGLGGERSDGRRTQGEVLLPTPTAMDAHASGGAVGSSNVTLTDATVRQADRFGIYQAACDRWEPTIGRPAPDPTEPTGRDGAQRLSPRFVEWMQGCPDGWVTDPAIWVGWKPGTARNAQLHALGNGVVNQQCAAAVTWLLPVRAEALSGRWAA